MTSKVAHEFTPIVHGSRFDKRLAVILRWEGGTSHDPHDRGGLTRFGISEKAYPGVDIKNLTLEDAKQIYQADYANKIRFAELPSGVDLIVFDGAVNQGVMRVSRCLQRAVGATDDGIIGPETIAAVRKTQAIRGSIWIVKEVAARRGKKYGEAGTFHVHGLGWMRRLIGITETSIALAMS